MAADCLPIMMTGDSESGTEQADRHMEYLFTPDIRHLYQAILSGCYEFVDLICIPADNESLARMLYYLYEEKHLDPSIRFKDIYLIDYMHTRFRTHRNYNYGRFVAFRQYLEEFTGMKITNEALSQVIKITSETKKCT